MKHLVKTFLSFSPRAATFAAAVPLLFFACSEEEPEQDHVPPEQPLESPEAIPQLPESFAELIAKAIEDSQRADEIANTLPDRLEADFLQEDIDQAQQELQSLLRSVEDAPLAKEANKGRIRDLEKKVQTLKDRRDSLMKAGSEESTFTKEAVKADVDELTKIHDLWYSPLVDVRIKQWQKLREDDKLHLEMKALFEDMDFVSKSLERRKIYLERHIKTAGQVDSAIKRIHTAVKPLLDEIRNYRRFRTISRSNQGLKEVIARLQHLEWEWSETEKMEIGIPPRRFNLSITTKPELGNDLPTRLANFHCLLERTCHEFALASYFVSLAANHGESLEFLLAQSDEAETVLNGVGTPLIKEAKTSLYESPVGILANHKNFYGGVLIDDENLLSSLKKAFEKVKETLDIFKSKGPLDSKAHLHAAVEDFLGEWETHGCPPSSKRSGQINEKHLRLLRAMANRESFLRQRGDTEYDSFMNFASSTHLSDWRAAALSGDPWAPALLGACYHRGGQMPSPILEKHLREVAALRQK